MTKKDSRYQNAKGLIEKGEITTFKDIFERNAHKKTAVANDAGIDPKKFNQLLRNTDGFKLSEIYILAALFDVSEKTMIDLMYNQRLVMSKGKRK